jgi:hypothetical protein
MCDLRDLIAQRKRGTSESGQKLLGALLDEESESVPFFLKGLAACLHAVSHR